MPNQAGAGSKTNFSVQKAERTHYDVRREFDFGSDDRGRMNPWRRASGSAQLRCPRFFRSLR